MVALADRVLAVLAEGGHEGFTETDLAVALFGSADGHTLQQMSAICERMMANGDIERRGDGTLDRPYTYHLPEGRLPRLGPG